MNKLFYTLAVSLGLLSFVPVIVSAQTSLPLKANVSAQVNASTTVGGGAGVQMSATAMTSIKTRAHAELQRRIDALTATNTRVQGLQQVTTTFKQSIQNAIQTQISAFQALDAKIQADTDAATLKADVQSITQSYRVYALVLPQIHITAAADRAVSIATMMQALGVKLNARIQAAAQAGADVTALKASLDDLAAKITDADAKAQASVAATASLTPDNGDKAKMDSNTAALKQARADLKVVADDLKAARADITKILAGLKALGSVGASASSTTSVQ